MYSRLDRKVKMEVAYSCDFFAIPDSLAYLEIDSSWCHFVTIEHFKIWPKMGEIDPKFEYILIKS